MLSQPEKTACRCSCCLAKATCYTCHALKKEMCLIVLLSVCPSVLAASAAAGVCQACKDPRFKRRRRKRHCNPARTASRHALSASLLTRTLCITVGSGQVASLHQPGLQTTLSHNTHPSLDRVCPTARSCVVTCTTCTTAWLAAREVLTQYRSCQAP